MPTISESMSLKHRWIYTDRGEPKYWEKNLSDCNIVRQKSHTDWPGTEPGWGNSRCLSLQPYETLRVRGQNVEFENAETSGTYGTKQRASTSA